MPHRSRVYLSFDPLQCIGSSLPACACVVYCSTDAIAIQVLGSPVVASTIHVVAMASDLIVDVQDVRRTEQYN